MHTVPVAVAARRWRLTLSLAFTFLALPNVCAANPDPFNFPYEEMGVQKYPRVRSEAKCPSGHTSLHVLPRQPFHAATKDDSKEVWVCSKCYYEFDLRHRFWHRWSRHPKNFAVPLSAFVRSFQVDKKDIYEGLQYSQYVKAGTVQWESAFIRTNLPINKSLEIATSVLEKSKIGYNVRSEEKNGYTYTYLSGKWEGYEFEVSVGKQIHWPNPSYISCEIKGEPIWELPTPPKLDASDR